MAISALPPVPNIKPKAPSTIMKGYIKFTAAKGVLPAKLDTKYPSTTPYTDVKIIIMIDGMVKRKSFLYVKCSDNFITAVSSFRKVSVYYSINKRVCQG